MSDYCYTGSAAAVCDLNISPYKIILDCLPSGEPTKPYDVVLGEPQFPGVGVFNFAKWDGTPDD